MSNVDDTSSVSQSRDPLVGITLDGRYRIEEVIGSGGMSVVYRATHLRLDREVAVKTLKLQVEDRSIVKERFAREIKSLSALNHPNIVSVYDSGIDDRERPYVVMDYLRGKSLETLIQHEGPLGIGRFSRIIVQICSALDHAHRKGIIHRDLKPGNIVLMDDETDFLKVVDFGLAHLGQDSRRLTHTGELWGSPPYMSPEQCKSEPVDERSDIYSLGAVMYEMLSGKDPFFDANTVFEFINKHVNVAPPPISDANTAVFVPEQLEFVIQKALAKIPADRFQNARELQDFVIEACSEQIGSESQEYLLHLATQSRTRPSGGPQSLGMGTNSNWEGNFSSRSGSSAPTPSELSAGVAGSGQKKIYSNEQARIDQPRGPARDPKSNTGEAFSRNWVPPPTSASPGSNNEPPPPTPGETVPTSLWRQVPKEGGLDKINDLTMEPMKPRMASLREAQSDKGSKLPSNSIQLIAIGIGLVFVGAFAARMLPFATNTQHSSTTRSVTQVQPPVVQPAPNVVPQASNAEPEGISRTSEASQPTAHVSGPENQVNPRLLSPKPHYPARPTNTKKVTIAKPAKSPKINASKKHPTTESTKAAPKKLNSPWSALDQMRGQQSSRQKHF